MEITLGQMRTLLEQVELSSKSHLDTAKANIKLFSGSNLLKKYILTQDEVDRYTLMQPPLLRLLSSYQRAYPEYYELRILLPDGYEDTRSTLTRLSNKTENEADSELFRYMQSAEQEFYVLYALNPDNDKPVLYLGKRLVLRDESYEPIGTPPTLRGYLTISVSLDFLQSQIDMQKVGQNGFLFVADQAGNPFIWPKGVKNAEFDKVTPHQAHNTDFNAKPIKTYFLGEAVYLQSRELYQNLNLYAVLPEKDLLGASRALGLIVASITLMMILLASGLTFYVINRILIQPIMKLGRSAQEIGRGQFNTSIGITSRDEIGELAQSFEIMSHNLQESQSQITYLAYHDALTGLPNRRMFKEFLERAVANVRRNNSGLALLFLDLDNFKKVNDTMGHQAGDELLQILAGRLTRCLREDDMVSLQNSDGTCDSAQDTISRVGGDEFLILLPCIDDPNGPAIVAQRMLEMLSLPFIINNQEFVISGSIGISLYPTDGETADILIKNADIAMYHAKEAGRNNYQYFNEDMNVAAFKRMTMENSLRRAIDNQEFQLYYQPKISINSGNVIGLEALIRWQHPELGIIEPNKFIPIAEDSGLIVQIGEWVIDEATRQLSRWQQDGVDLCLSINISTVQLNKQNLAEVIDKYIRQNNCRSDYLEVELTETSIMDAHEPAINMLNKIKSLGVKITMDDFGVGYSSFRYLRNLPIDVLKIDRSFVRHITTNKDDATIVSAIIVMAHTLNLQVVAEGVETHEQLQFLRSNRCDFAQGYLFSQPLPANQLKKFIDTRN